MNHKQIRLIDESEEDYLYAVASFDRIVLPVSTVARAAGTCLSKISHDHLALAVVALVLAFGLHVG